MVNRKSSRQRRGVLNLRVESLERRELLAAGFMRPALVEPADVNDAGSISPTDTVVVNDVGARSSLDAVAGVTRVNGRPPRAPLRGNDGGPDPNGGTDDGTSIEFASIDGTGNNQDHESWGSVGQVLARWTATEYADGVSEPGGEDRLSAREISNIVVATPGDIDNADGLSDLTWVFGQFIDHDISLSEAGDEAFDIEVPTGDPWFDPLGTGEVTIGINRTDYIEGTEDELREHFNEITAFIDGSVIYGSDQERADALRTFENGMLATSDGDLLPFNDDGLANAGGTSNTLFLAGDIRANENAALTAMHTLWVREHNRVAAEIAERDPSLSDEEIYQRARQFVTAELQSITYNEFLPALLGEDAIPEYAGYDASVNPNISNVFSTAAYRFGHTMLSAELLRLNNNGSVIDADNLALQDAFFNPDAISENGIDSILLGATVQTAQAVDPYLVDDVRNFLFGAPGAGGFDLASLNIQRGRDHGLADFNQIRVDMGMSAVESFADVSSDPEIQRRLEEAYGDVNSIDAWVGMIAEDHADGSALGVTATTIITQQFAQLRDGDRFYYENVFSGNELRRIENTTLADVVERNTSIDFAGNANVFFASEAGITDSQDDLAEVPPEGTPIVPPTFGPAPAARPQPAPVGGISAGDAGIPTPQGDFVEVPPEVTPAIPPTFRPASAPRPQPAPSTVAAADQVFAAAGDEDALRPRTR